MLSFIQEMDFSILDFIQAHFRCDILDKLMVFFSTIGNYGFIWIAIAIVLLFFRKTRRLALIICCSLLFTYLVGELAMKNIFMRVRPCNINYDVDMLLGRPQTYSFPSGHTGSSFSAATAIFLKNKKWGIAALVLASLIAFSRLYNYVHFPTDVLAGILLGVLSAFIFTAVFNKFNSNKVLQSQ